MAKQLTIREALKVSNYDIDTIGITQSILSNFDCRRKFLLSTNGWGKPREKNFIFGRIGHDCLDKYYQGEEYESLIDAAYLKDQENDEPLLEDIQYDFLRIMIQRYTEYYSSDKKLKIIAPEQKFSVMFENTLLRGKIDLIINILKKYWLMEHKFYSSIDVDNMILSLSFNSQILFYALAAEILYNREIRGVIYNIIRRPRFKKMNTFLEKINENPEHFFFRFEILTDSKSLKEFKMELKEKLSDVRKLLKKEIYPYKNENACVQKYACEFLEACALGHMTGYIQGDNLMPELEDEENGSN